MRVKICYHAYAISIIISWADQNVNLIICVENGHLGEGAGSQS